MVILQLEWNRVDFERRVIWLDPGTIKNGEGRGSPLKKDEILALCLQANPPRWYFTSYGELTFTFVDHEAIFIKLLILNVLRLIPLQYFPD
jgi:hypothetical protein